jgi:hypothetical protein
LSWSAKGLEDKMSEGIVVKLPVSVLAEVVSCADGSGAAVEALENLNSEWAVVFRTYAAAASNPPLDAPKTQTEKFETREEMVAFLERAHVDPLCEIVAALKNGVPRNVKVKVQVQFR